jgi:hypothetical protein
MKHYKTHYHQSRARRAGHHYHMAPATSKAIAAIAAHPSGPIFKPVAAPVYAAGDDVAGTAPIVVSLGVVAAGGVEVSEAGGQFVIMLVVVTVGRIYVLLGVAVVGAVDDEVQVPL